MPWKRKKKTSHLRYLRYNKKRRSVKPEQDKVPLHSHAPEKKEKNQPSKISQNNKKRRSVKPEQDKIPDSSHSYEKSDQIPDLLNTVDRFGTLNDSLEVLNRTKTPQNTHKACVCVICDCFIIGVEEIHWLTTDQIKSKGSY